MVANDSDGDGIGACGDVPLNLGDLPDGAPVDGNDEVVFSQAGLFGGRTGSNFLNDDRGTIAEKADAPTKLRGDRSVFHSQLSRSDVLVVGDDPFDIGVERAHGEGETLKTDGGELPLSVEEIGGAITAGDGEAIFFRVVSVGGAGGRDPGDRTIVAVETHEDFSGSGRAGGEGKGWGDAVAVEFDDGEAAAGMSADVACIGFGAVGSDDAKEDRCGIADPAAQDKRVTFGVHYDPDHFTGRLLHAIQEPTETRLQYRIGMGVVDFLLGITPEERLSGLTRGACGNGSSGIGVGLLQNFSTRLAALFAKSRRGIGGLCGSGVGSVGYLTTGPVGKIFSLRGREEADIVLVDANVDDGSADFFIEGL